MDYSLETVQSVLFAVPNLLHELLEETGYLGVRQIKKEMIMKVEQEYLAECKRM